MPLQTPNSTETQVFPEIPWRACHCCGLVQRIPAESAQVWICCVRCASRFRPRSTRMAPQRTAAAALAALLLYIPAMTLPLLEIERLGYRHASSVISGIADLFRHGNVFVAVVVLTFSVLLPLAKLLLLLELCWLKMFHVKHRALTYRIVELAGKWGMMDVLLLALLVMTVKIGSLVQFHLGPAVLAFVVCIIMSLVASLCFDPHSIWDDSV